MAWIMSHQSLLSHRKTLRAAAALRVRRPQLIGHLHILWWWCLDNATAAGDLGDTTDAELELAAEWDGDPGAFVSAITLAGFLETSPDGRRLHDWGDYSGRLAARRVASAEGNRRRQREYRDRHALRGEPVTRDVTRDVTENNGLEERREDLRKAMGGGTGEPSDDPSAIAEGTPTLSPAAVAAPPPVSGEDAVWDTRDTDETAAQSPTPAVETPLLGGDPLLAALQALRLLPAYHARTDDLEWLSGLARVSPTTALEREIPKCRDWWAPRDGRAGAKRPNWRSRLNNWIDTAQRRASDMPPFSPRASPSAPLRLDEDPEVVAETLRLQEVRRARSAGAVGS